MTPEERMVAVKTFRPELASINMGSINFGLFPAMGRALSGALQGKCVQEHLYGQERIFKIMQDTGTKPEMECYDMAHLRHTACWADKA